NSGDVLAIPTAKKCFGIRMVSRKWRTVSMSEITCFLGDCLYEMDKIRNSSIDMILTDLPYGTTQNSWDSNIDLKRLWKQYLRIIKTYTSKEGRYLVRTGAPCMNCQDRYIACHSSCAAYKEWSQAREKARHEDIFSHMWSNSKLLTFNQWTKSRVNRWQR
ncbi:MAG: hypothetical protein ACI3U2_04170, partial [Anaerovibrio sp.]